MKTIFKLLIVSLLTIASFPATYIYGEDNESNSAFQVQEASESNQQITFEETDILSFDLVSIVPRPSNDSVYAIFNVINNSENPVDYMSIDFAYIDSEGNQLDNDGRFNDFQVLSSKSALINTFSDLSQDDFSEIIITSYDYEMGEYKYYVDLQKETVERYHSEKESAKSFEEANILDFTLNDLGLNGSYYSVETQINNSGNQDIIYVSLRMAYLDENGNLLDKDGRFNDELLRPGNFVTVKSSTNTDSTISGYGVFSYEYTLSEPDDYGFNTYDVNLQTLEVIGRNRDR